jgi:hypothetical protein
MRRGRLRHSGTGRVDLFSIPRVPQCLLMSNARAHEALLVLLQGKRAYPQICRAEGATGELHHLRFLARGSGRWSHSGGNPARIVSIRSRRLPFSELLLHPNIRSLHSRLRVSVAICGLRNGGDRRFTLTLRGSVFLCSCHPIPLFFRRRAEVARSSPTLSAAHLRLQTDFADPAP